MVPGTDNHGTGPDHGTGVNTNPTPVVNSGPPQRVVVEPRMVSVRVCKKSGMLAGDDCDNTEIRSFIDGQQPTRTCNVCKPKQNQNLLNESSEAVLIHDVQADAPDSLPEGQATCVTAYWVNTECKTEGVEVSQSSGNRAWDRVAVAATKKLRYKPAMQGGQPQRQRHTRPYTAHT